MESSTSPPRFLRIVPHSSCTMEELKNESIHLIVTSPPYPMIAMWDAQFSQQDPAIGKALEEERGNEAFERMHLLLDQVWKECYRVLCPGGFLCINIGDATRTIGGEFQLYSNHSRITEACRAMGFTVLPLILWRKTTNAPNKFMGAGMFPAGAYVTLEHEYILIFRKGGKRQFRTPGEKTRRWESAFFWEERNRWFVDLWDLSGVRQGLGLEDGELKAAVTTRGERFVEEVSQSVSSQSPRSRSAAFPLELAYRLILMYSLREDWVLDPFLGTGTTLAAAAITGRNGVGYEVERGLMEEARRNILSCKPMGVQMLEDRLHAHRQFMSQRKEKLKNSGRPGSKGVNAHSYWNDNLQVPVVTRQETHLRWEVVQTIEPLPEGRGSSELISFQVTLRPFTPEDCGLPF